MAVRMAMRIGRGSPVDLYRLGELADVPCALTKHPHGCAEIRRVPAPIRVVISGSHCSAEQGNRLNESGQFLGPVVVVQQAERAHIDVGGITVAAMRPLV